jgi:Tol biopolymer transport system component
MTVSAQKQRLAFTDVKFSAHIWRTELRGPNPAARQQEFVASSIGEKTQHYSPDGRKIAFSSTRSGSQEIWVANSDGSDPVKLTAFNDAACIIPRWSPDGREIAFEVDRLGRGDVWVVGAEGGAPRKVIENGFSPSWSHDKKWIYYTSHRTGRFQIEKATMSNLSSSVVHLTKGGGFTALESTDGQFVYYAKGHESTSVWKVPAAGGDETLIVDSLSNHMNFDVTKKGIYFITDADDRGRSSLRFFEFATGHTRTLSTLTSYIGWGLAVSPDEHWLLYNSFDVASDLMLIENFR